MHDAKCDTCPISADCNAYNDAIKDNDCSYHPQSVVRVWSKYCPLVRLIKKLQDKEVK